MSAFDLMTPRSEFAVVKNGEAKPYKTASPIAVEDDRGTIVGLLKAGTSKADPETAFFPEKTPILRLFASMFESKIEAALVINEYGEVTGMIERRKIAAFLCGVTESPHRKNSGKDGFFIFQASTEIAEIEETLGIDIQKGPYKTLGGFITEIRHHIPPVGSKFIWNNLIFTIIEASSKQILLVRIDRLDR